MTNPNSLRPLQVAAACLGLLGAAAARGGGQAPAPIIANELDELLASDGVKDDGFGSALAIEGDTALIGVGRQNNAGGLDAGAVYVFVRSGTTWTELQKLTASDGLTRDYFGESVALSGDLAVIGAPGDDQPGVPKQGSVYVFGRSGSTWTELTKLAASDGQAQARFGTSVGIVDDRIVVGAPGDTHAAGVDAGAVYVFTGAGAAWTQQHKLVASDAEAGDEFGNSMDLEGDSLLIGAPFDGHSGFDAAGAAYVFIDSGRGWDEQAKLVAGSPAAHDWFGWSVSLDGDTALVGAQHVDTMGAAYAFVRNGSAWSEQQKLIASGLEPGDDFGQSVFLHEDLALIGSPGNDLVPGSGFSPFGVSYLFERSGATWSEQLRLTPSSLNAGQGFGSSGVIQGAAVMVGSPRSRVFSGGVQSDKGSVFVYELTSSSAAVYCTAGTSASGCTAVISGGGMPSASISSGFVLAADSIEGAVWGLFFWGTNGRQANPWGNGSSFQCVVPPVNRGGPTQTGGTSGTCEGSLAQDLNATWCSTCPDPQKNPGAGAVVQAQLWYRDALSTSNQTTSLSDAIEFVVGL